MKAKLLALAVISAFALSACASGGNDSKPKVDNTTKPAQNSGDNNGGTTGGGSTSTETPFTMKQQVATFKQTIKNGEPVSMTNTPTYSTSNGDGDNFKKITVNGYTFTMLDTSGNAALDEDRTLVGQDNNYGEYQVIPNINNRGTAYAKYGYTIDYKTSNFNLFYQGKPTPVAEVPTTGKATYQGYAFALDPVERNKHITQKERDYGEWKGVSEFTVDFDKKTLTGTLSGWHSSSQPQPKAVQINAKIQANTFQGTANKTGYAEGKFYGPKAQNLAGAFNDKSQNLQGVFGGNKQ